MLEILQDFESAVGGTARLSPVVLVGPGLVCVIAGLFIWLGGLGYRKLLAAVSGAITAGACSFFAMGQNFVATVFIAIMAGAIVMLFERLFIVILAAALTATFSFFVLAGPNIDNSKKEAATSPGQISSHGQVLGVRESAEKMKDYIINARRKIKHAGSQMPAYKWGIMAVVMILCIIAGSSFGRLTSALCCSALGTVLIFTGMILLLLNKGSMPVSIISSRQSSFLVVSAAMTAFGTIEQLLLCKQTKTSPAAKVKKGGKKEKSGQIKQSWRGK